MLVGETKEAFKKLSNLPTLPGIATALLRTSSEERLDAEEVTRLIEADPATSARILRIVNSSYAGLPGRVSSLNRAVVLLGVNGVRNALLSVQIFNIFGDAARREKSVLFDIWKHCLAVASASELIAENIGGILPEDAFTAGLLHDIGKIALYHGAPDEYAEVLRLVEEEGLDISQAELRVFEINHAEAGRFLAERWNLPEALTQAIYLHHQPSVVGAGDDPISVACGVVSLADDLVRHRQIGYSGTTDSWEPVQTAFARIGLTEESIRDIDMHLVERMSMRSGILDIELPEAAIYYECLEKANARLGEVTEKYTLANLALQRANSRLAAISNLNASLGSSFDTGDVLAGVAREVQSYLGAEKVIVYCLDQKGRTLSGSVKSGQCDARSFFIAAAREVESDVASLTEDRDVLKFLVTELTGRLEPTAGPTSIASGKMWLLPVRVGVGERAGIIVEDGGAGFDMQEARFFSEAASLALERAILEERLRRETARLVDSNRRSKDFYEELVNAKKLVAIGRMAAGAAHEINNPLAIVSGRVQLLLKMETDEGKRKHLEMMRSQCDRMSKIISDILTFARPEKPALKAVDLSRSLDAVIALVEPAAAAKGLKIIKEIPPDLPALAADAAKIEQAFRNILANAVDASQPGQDVKIAAEAAEKGRFIAVFFADKGVGMDEETLGRIFEPFFTTKEGRGTGLGLSICHSIVQTHGGRIRVKSAPGKGTVFTVLLPVWRKE